MFHGELRMKYTEPFLVKNVPLRKPSIQHLLKLQMFPPGWFSNNADILLQDPVVLSNDLMANYLLDQREQKPH